MVRSREQLRSVASVSLGAMGRRRREAGSLAAVVMVAVLGGERMEEHWRLEGGILN